MLTQKESDHLRKKAPAYGYGNKNSRQDKSQDKKKKKQSVTVHVIKIRSYTELFISPSGISELDCATTKTDTAEVIISIGRESLQVFFVLGALAYFQVPPLGGSRD